ncbi:MULTISPECIES: hypothetical protein [unclassified Colwellia]|uniref:hypothetical protein n=1 Tax=unclassified Colwellia TaxID=196834 RepID=UPI0015F5BF38|nr:MULTISPECIES: hypothetical protein [unclassified Colwellia]MBA6233649.1 hypothetical protein [Colwellia sp. MB02u-7]MBA6237289.1 hypothetical protein [Colwellia sp. MB02u-11]MBA6300534.1 hypothetical protein [Colwellia sp. MB3u-22]MBA6311125.1 hypothetical protein [Colwellia sp. MB3u-64]
MQLLKSFFIILVISISLPSLGDVERKHIIVNFSMLASNENELNGQKIGIRGWILFDDYEKSKKAMLFPTEESKRTFNVDEAIQIDIIKEDYEAVKKYLSGSIVTVYGTYKIINSKYTRLFGAIIKIDDIDIVHVDL